MTEDERLNAALDRFETCLPLLKLLVAQVPSEPMELPGLVRVGAIALFQAALDYDPASGFGFTELAEHAISCELLARYQDPSAPLPEWPPELAPSLNRLEALTRSLSLGVRPYVGGLVGRPPQVPAEFVAAEGGAAGGEGLAVFSRLLRERWPLILGFVILTEAGILGIAFKSPKTYKATTTINTGIASGQPLSGTPIDWFKAGALMGNLTEMIESRTVLERTILRLRLTLPPEKLAKLLEVEKVGATDMLRIAAVGKTPQEAADLANAHTAEFMGYYRQSQGADARSADQFILEQLEGSAQRLKEAEEQLRAFKQSNLPEAQTTLSTQLSELQTQRGEVERALRGAQSGLSTIEHDMASLQGDPSFARTVRDSAEVEAAGERLKTLQQNLADARAVYGEPHRIVQDLKAQIERANRSLSATTAKVAAADPARADVLARRIALRVEIAQQNAKLRQIDRMISELEPRARSASAADVTFKQLQRDVAIREAEYQRLQERASQTHMAASGASTLPLTIVDAAVPPHKPEDSKTLVKLVLGLLLSLACGVVLAYALEWRRLAQERVEASFHGPRQR